LAGEVGSADDDDAAASFGRGDLRFFLVALERSGEEGEVATEMPAKPRFAEREAGAAAA
jgi:hypothetical protein